MPIGTGLAVVTITIIDAGIGAAAIVTYPSIHAVDVFYTICGVLAFHRITAAGLLSWAVIIAKAEATVSIFTYLAKATLVVFETGRLASFAFTHSGIFAVDVCYADLGFVTFARTGIAQLISRTVCIDCAFGWRATGSVPTDRRCVTLCVYSAWVRTTANATKTLAQTVNVVGAEVWLSTLTGVSNASLKPSAVSIIGTVGLDNRPTLTLITDSVSQAIFFGLTLVGFNAGIGIEITELTAGAITINKTVSVVDAGTQSANL